MNGTRAATVNEVAQAVEMAASTVAMANPFFASIGLLQRLAVGTYAPSEEVIAFFAVKDPEAAPRQLASTFRQAWFGQVLIPRLMYAPIEEQAALALLEEVSCASPEYKKALGFTLDLMAAAQLIERSEGQIKLLPDQASPGGTLLQSPPTVVFDKTSDRAQFRVDIHVDSKDLANWGPEKITAFFHAVAALLEKE